MSWHEAFKARSDLEKYGSNSIGLFAMALRFALEDLDTVASESIVDGPDDKKCDIVYVDTEERYVVIAQCYLSPAATKPAAKSDKAADLNTAIAWLLDADMQSIPAGLQPSAMALRSALGEGLVDDLYVWYTHNLPESKNVANELKTIEDSLHSRIHGLAADGKRVNIEVIEVGSERLERWYAESLTPILVSDEFSIQTKGGFSLKAKDWEAFVTAIPASFLRTAYRKHKTDLFSANVRDYLGARRSDANINNGIIQTAGKEGENFWAYNNGITVLVNDFTFNLEDQKLKISGASIVNGAQTTGALGSVNESLGDVWVPARFIKTADHDVVTSVIRFNNSQNKVTAADFRSTDKTQKRLRSEMEKIPDVEYEGGRRGGVEAVIKRKKNLLPAYTVGQALAAMHGDPVAAYHEKSEIWANDRLYAQFFNEQTSARHIVFAYKLLRTVESRKFDLATKAKNLPDDLTQSENQQLQFFRNRGATLLACAGVSSCLEIILDKKIQSLWRFSFGDASPDSAQSCWELIIRTLSPLLPKLDNALKDGLKNRTTVRESLQTFSSLVEATAAGNAEIYKKFAHHIVRD